MQHLPTHTCFPLPLPTEPGGFKVKAAVRQGGGRGRRKAAPTNLAEDDGEDGDRNGADGAAAGSPAGEGGQDGSPGSNTDGREEEEEDGVAAERRVGRSGDPLEDVSASWGAMYWRCGLSGCYVDWTVISSGTLQLRCLSRRSVSAGECLDGACGHSCNCLHSNTTSSFVTPHLRTLCRTRRAGGRGQPGRCPLRRLAECARSARTPPSCTSTPGCCRVGAITRRLACFPSLQIMLGPASVDRDWCTRPVVQVTGRSGHLTLLSCPYDSAPAAGYRTNAAFTNHAIVSFFRRIAEPHQLTLEPMLYQVGACVCL